MNKPGLGAFRPFLRVVGDVAIPVPVQQVLIGAEQEGAGAAGGVEDAQRFAFAHALVAGLFAFQQRARGCA